MREVIYKYILYIILRARFSRIPRECNMTKHCIDKHFKYTLRICHNKQENWFDNIQIPVSFTEMFDEESDVRIHDNLRLLFRVFLVFLALMGCAVASALIILIYKEIWLPQQVRSGIFIWYILQ